MENEEIMMYGTTYEKDEYIRQEILKQIKKRPFEKRFAWLPKTLPTGKKIIFQTYYVRRSILTDIYTSTLFDRGYEPDQMTNKPRVYLLKEVAPIIGRENESLRSS